MTEAESESNEQTPKDIQNEIDEKKPLLSFRWMLVWMSSFVFFSQVFVRTSFSVSMVAMVIVNETDSVDSAYENDICRVPYYDESDSENSSGEFEWTASQQGIILSAFFWGNLISRFFGSRIGERVGQRATTTTLIFIGAVLELFSPIAANIHPMVLAATRFLIGLTFGPLPALLQSLLSSWAPRSELSTMMTTTYAGATLGGMFGLVASSVLTNTFSWRFPFWLGGVLSLAGLPFWVVLVRNTPKEHPWLSPHERKLLEQNKHFTTKKTVPWKKILLSPYVHIFTYTSFARGCLDTVLTTEGPSFLKYKIGLDLNTAGYVTGCNYLFSMLSMIFYGRISDMIINRKYFNKIHVRKMFHYIATGGSSIFLIGLTFAECNTPAVIVIWVLMGALTSAISCSYMASVIDIAPNYTGTVMGINAIGNIGSALTPSVVSALLKSENGWNKTFFIAAGLNIVSCVLYLGFMTAEVQPWNYEKKEEKTDIDPDKSEDETKF